MSTEPRGQADRREQTRQALLDATIDSLRQHGLAGTSARRVAEAAGVSQGALQHHFKTKFALIEAALSSHLVAQLQDVDVGDLEGLDERGRAAAVLDGLWAFHRIPVFEAVFELLAVAKRDATISAAVARTLDVLVGQAEAAARAALPQAAAAADFSLRLRVVIDSIRGTALLDGLPMTGAGRPFAWTELREELVTELLDPR